MMANKLDEVMALRKNKQLAEANKVMIKLVEEEPTNALYQYHCAWSYDNLGEETKAVPHYEKAIQLGLEPTELEGAYLGLGSTYRTIGQYEQAKQIFEKAIQTFPEAEQMNVFYAMTLHNLGEHSLAMETLLTSLTKTTAHEGILRYKEAIQFYSNKLNQVWK